MFASLLKSIICLSTFIVHLISFLFALHTYCLPAQMSYVEKHDNFKMQLLGIYNVNRCFGNMSHFHTQQASVIILSPTKCPKYQKPHEANGFGAAIIHFGGWLSVNCCGGLKHVQRKALWLLGWLCQYQTRLSVPVSWLSSATLFSAMITTRMCVS